MLAGTETAGSAMDSPAIYYGYDSNETVPADMCLIGCIFYMGEYLKTDPCEDWIKVRAFISTGLRWLESALSSSTCVCNAAMKVLVLVPLRHWWTGSCIRCRKL